MEPLPLIIAFSWLSYIWNNGLRRIRKSSGNDYQHVLLTRCVSNPKNPIFAQDGRAGGGRVVLIIHIGDRPTTCQQKPTTSPTHLPTIINWHVFIEEMQCTIEITLDPFPVAQPYASSTPQHRVSDESEADSGRPTGPLAQATGPPLSGAKRESAC